MEKGKRFVVTSEDVFCGIVLIFKESRRTESVYDLLAMDIDLIPNGKMDEVQELSIASVVDVSVSTNIADQSALSAPPKYSPEVL